METLYAETGTLTSNSSLSHIYNAVGGVFLVSQVNVESEVLNTGGCAGMIADWQAWFWDTYDWNLAGQSVVIPLDLFNRLPAIAPYQSTIEAMLNATGIPPSVLQELKVEDAQMRQIEGKNGCHAGRKHHAAEGLPDLQRRFVAFRCEQQRVRQVDRSDDNAA